MAISATGAGQTREPSPGARTAMEICKTELEGAKNAPDEIAAELAALEKSAPPPSPAPAAPAPAGALRTEKIVERAREDAKWVKALLTQAEAQYRAAQNARNDAERQVALKDALLKTASARHLAESVKSAVQHVRTASATAQQAAPPAASPRQLSDGFLAELKEVEARSRAGAAATGVDRAVGWAKSAFGDSTPAPGGILFSRATVSALRLNLRVQGVSYDAARGEIVLAGAPSSQPLDVDLFATGLRLGLEPDEPYFSLDPIVPETHGEEWQAFTRWVHETVTREPYLVDGYPCRGRGPRAGVPWNAMTSPAEAAKLIERVCGEPAPADLSGLRARADRFASAAAPLRLVDGSLARFGPLQALDPALIAEGRRRFPNALDAKLVFHPGWLRATRAGETLYRADVALKELVSPVDEHGRATRVAQVRGAVLDVRRDDREATLVQRWWFMPGGGTAADARVIDVSEIEPRVHAVSVIGGADAESIPLPASDRAARDDVNRRFPDYAEVIPEWRGVAELFRGYVVARWLREHAPDFGQRLLEELPEPRPASRKLPELHATPVVLALADPKIDYAPDGRSGWSGGWRWVAEGGIGFSTPPARGAAPSPALRAALEGHGSDGVVVARLKLLERPSALRQTLASITTHRAAVRMPDAPALVEDHLRGRYESERRGLERRQGGVFGILAAAVSWWHLGVVAAVTALVVPVIGRWRLQ
jgi:hypothetical protein